ncbi:MAG: acyl-ACP--UDP-N-acetylglucosamine O-acyltransferase [Kiritimatiellae bacterium]|nr:acyl-ACP--UDP-N-acetylglucosamine O-acyltransferase [Kiritimatiellia bacterium]
MTSIHPTAVIEDGAIIGEDVEIGPYSVIGPNVVIGDRVKLMPHVVVDGFTTFGEDCTVFSFASIGSQTQDLKYHGAKTTVEIGARTTLREYVTVNSGTNEGEVTKIGSGCHIMAYAHIAHACSLGDGVIMANCATLAGDVHVGDQAIIGGLSGVHQFVRIGKLCMIGGCAKIVQDCMPFMIVDGNPARTRAVNSIGMKRKNIDASEQASLKQAHKILCRDGLSTAQALEKIHAEVEGTSAIEYLLSFVESSSRGIIK